MNDAAICNDHRTKFLKSELHWKTLERWVSLIMLQNYLFDPTNPTRCSVAPWLPVLAHTSPHKDTDLYALIHHLRDYEAPLHPSSQLISKYVSDGQVIGQGVHFTEPKT